MSTKHSINSERSDMQATMVFYVPPHKLLRVLTDMQNVMGPERQCCVARELTKVHETFLRGPLEDIIQHVEANGVKGEVTLLVEGSKSVAINTTQSAVSAVRSCSAIHA